MKRKKPMRWTPHAEGLAFWRGQRAVLKARSGGKCEGIAGDAGDYLTTWHAAGCAQVSYIGRDAAHLKPLGRGRSRYDKNDPLNDVTNLRWLSRYCHDRMEAERLKLTAASKRL